MAASTSKIYCSLNLICHPINLDWIFWQSHNPSKICSYFPSIFSCHFLLNYYNPTKYWSIYLGPDSYVKPRDIYNHMAHLTQPLNQDKICLVGLLTQVEEYICILLHILISAWFLSFFITEEEKEQTIFIRGWHIHYIFWDLLIISHQYLHQYWQGIYVNFRNGLHDTRHRTRSRHTIKRFDFNVSQSSCSIFTWYEIIMREWYLNCLGMRKILIMIACWNCKWNTYFQQEIYLFFHSLCAMVNEDMSRSENYTRTLLSHSW